MAYRLNKLLFFPIIYLIMLLASCATPEDVGRVQWDLNQLRKKTDALEKSLPDEKGQMADFEEAQKATTEAVSDLFIKTQDLARDVQRITGQLEEGRYDEEKRLEDEQKSRAALSADLQAIKTALNEDLQAIRTDIEGLDKRLAEIEESAGTGDVTEQAETAEKKDEPPAEDVPEVKDEEKPAGSPAETEIKDAYMNAYEAYKAGRNRDARERFAAFIRDYPENEYTDNARFWIAESHYSEKSYEDAILSYEELFRKNPDSDKVPGAMLKQGMSFFELKDKATGRLILDQLIEKFPDSEQAAVAREKLGESSTKK
jgi:tol-pal system protein YbgF